MKYFEYSKTLPLARRIYNSLDYPHSTIQEIANSYNKVAIINKILINEKE